MQARENSALLKEHRALAPGAMELLENKSDLGAYSAEHRLAGLGESPPAAPQTASSSSV